MKYNFAVAAIDGRGNKGPLSAMVQSTTEGEVFLPAAVPESGSESSSFLAIVLALLMGGVFLVVSRRRT